MIRDQAFWKDQPACFSRVIEDVWGALQPSTTEKYCLTLRNFFHFSLLNSSEVKLPVGPIVSASFLVFLRERGYSKFSIKLGLVSLKWVNSFFPEASKLDDPFLSRIVASATRNCLSAKNQKVPLSQEIIRKILSRVSNLSLLQTRDALIMALSFSLLLRNDELRHLCCSHIEERTEGLVFNIVSSKTDVFRGGKKLFLARNSGDYCVVNLLKKYLLMARLEIGANSFVFGPISRDARGHFINGKFQLSYASCLAIFKRQLAAQKVNPLAFGTHSARSGGASALARKVTPFELMLSGRWADARSLRNYVEVPEKRRFEISRNISL